MCSLGVQAVRVGEAGRHDDGAKLLKEAELDLLRGVRAQRRGLLDAGLGHVRYGARTRGLSEVPLPQKIGA